MAAALLAATGALEGSSAAGTVHVGDDGLKQRIEGAGAEVEGPIQLGPGRAIYVTDPDGNVVEFWSQDMAAYTDGARAGGGPGTFRDG